MMKKVFALTLALIAVLTMASPAQAAHVGKRTYYYSFSGMTVYFQVMVNTSDIGPKIEALADSGLWTITGEPDPDIRYDWVHLYKNGNVVATTGSGSGWMNIGAAYSTNWEDWTCASTANWRAVARYQIRWHNGANPPDLSIWYKEDSATVSNWC